jgi:hypothetical protein
MHIAPIGDHAHKAVISSGAVEGLGNVRYVDDSRAAVVTWDSKRFISRGVTLI